MWDPPSEPWGVLCLDEICNKSSTLTTHWGLRSLTVSPIFWSHVLQVVISWQQWICLYWWASKIHGCRSEVMTVKLSIHLWHALVEYLTLNMVSVSPWLAHSVTKYRLVLRFQSLQVYLSLSTWALMSPREVLSWSHLQDPTQGFQEGCVLWTHPNILIGVRAYLSASGHH